MVTFQRLISRVRANSLDTAIKHLVLTSQMRKDLHQPTKLKKDLNTELKGAKAELVQMSDELRRMRANESSLTAENQILKSKLMHSDPSLANDVVEMSPTKSIPKLSGPPSANRTNT